MEDNELQFIEDNETENETENESSILTEFVERKQYSESKRSNEISILKELENFARSKQYNQLLKPSLTSDYNDDEIPHSQKEVKENANEFGIKVEVYENGDRIDSIDDAENAEITEDIEFRGTNILSHAVNLKAGNNMNLNPQPEVSTENPHDTQKIEKVQALLDTIWEKQNLQDHVNEQIYIAKLKPLTITHFEWDNNIKNIPTASPEMKTQGDFTVKIVDPINIWWDPSAYKIQDMDYFIIATSMTLTKLRNNFKGNPEILAKLTKERLEKAEPITEGTEGSVDSYDDTQILSNPQDPLYTLFTYYTKEINDEGEVIISCHYILGTEELLYSVDDIGIPFFPLAALRDFKIPQSFFGYSTGQAVLPYQKYLTILEIKEAKLLKAKGKEIVLMNKEFGLNSDIIKSFFEDRDAGSVLIAGVDYKNKNTPIHNQFSKITIGENEIDFLQKLQQFTIELSNKTLGITDAYEASSFGSQQTKGGVSSIISKANTIDSTITNNLNVYLKELFNIILAYLKFNYTPRAFSVNMESKTAQSRKYPEGIFQEDRQNQLSLNPSGTPNFGPSLEGGQGKPAIDAGMQQALAQGAAPDMGGMPTPNNEGQAELEGLLAQGTPPMGGMEEMMGQGIPQSGMGEMMGMAQPPSPTDKFRTLTVDPATTTEGETANEFAESDFDIDVDIYNQTSSQKAKNDEYMLNYIDRKQQQGMAPPELLRTVWSQVGFSNQFINKAVKAEKDQQEKMEQQQQAQQQQAQQMQAATMMNQQSMGQDKIKADLVKGLISQAGQQQKAAASPPSNKNVK